MGTRRSSNILAGDRGSNISATQRALMDEVMEEERLASKDAHQEQAELQAREKEEVSKEQEKLKRTGSTDEGLPRTHWGGSQDFRRGSMRGDRRQASESRAGLERVPSSQSGRELA